jgi:hypothetical protein
MRGHGLNVINLYRELYEKEFQFVYRNKPDIIDVRPRERSFQLFTSCVYGSFPDDRELDYVQRAFADAFDPRKVDLDTRTFQQLHESGSTSALEIGHEKLDVYFNDHRAPTLFVLNAHESKDLIDFWNLRAVQRTVVPIPVQWLDDLSPYYQAILMES